MQSQSPADVLARSFADLCGGEREEAPRGPVPAPAEEIRDWVHRAIFEPDPARTYRINPPPTDRPVRIYADGVYDLFHYAHALQLRQAKLSFPNVHLIVGVVSSPVCEEYKNRPVMESGERYEAVRQCRWVDEVLEDAPWVIGQELIDALQIDYVAHDEIPYAAGGAVASDDVYDWLKRLGKFLPTRRTEGVSTSELLARIVRTYRAGDLDGKLTKMGEASLTSGM
ncbi:choline-phosphate cytidylyltransferase [Malassezia cuniculi]|uniref:choline-phosphate cytidylyltransferase n=1 Tax=Malassezia cuniculi TaxID=948313 RepID=A0AAF0EZM9_9BASI|nr:choline-phosphate cytidylyltransferase [Malassezia cuniculi]